MRNGEKTYPRLHGQHYNYMLRQIEWILNGKRRNVDPAMVTIIKNLSKEEIALVLNYVSRLPVPKELLAPSADWTNPDFE